MIGLWLGWLGCNWLKKIWRHEEFSATTARPNFLLYLQFCFLHSFLWPDPLAPHTMLTFLRRLSRHLSTSGYLEQPRHCCKNQSSHMGWGLGNLIGFSRYIFAIHFYSAVIIDRQFYTHPEKSVAGTDPPLVPVGRKRGQKPLKYCSILHPLNNMQSWTHWVFWPQILSLKYQQVPRRCLVAILIPSFWPLSSSTAADGGTSAILWVR